MLILGTAIEVGVVCLQTKNELSGRGVTCDQTQSGKIRPIFGKLKHRSSRMRTAVNFTLALAYRSTLPQLPYKE